MHSRRRGFSLIESMIVMGVMIVILVAAQIFASSGVHFYRNSVQALEVQQATLVALTNMAHELEGSHLDPIIVSPAQDSVIFPSPAKLDGSYENSDEGVILWHSIVGYSLRTLPDGLRVIERKAEAHPPVDYPPDPMNIGGTAHDFAHFAGVSASGVMARYVATPDADDPNPFIIEKKTDKLVLTLKVEFSQTTKDSMKVTTEVFPRN